MKKAKHLFVCIFCWLSLSACERSFFEEEYSAEDPYVTFDYLWEEVDRHYSFFQVKKIDWEAVRLNYRARIYEGIPHDSLFNVLGGMLRELRDDHSNLRSYFNTAFYGVRFDGPDNYDRRIVEDNYIGRDYYVSGPLIHDFIAGGEVGYVRLSAFTGNLEEKHLDFVFQRYQNTRGLIIDLRENGGGAIREVFDLMGRLVDVESVLFYSRIRNGEAHEDFSELERATVSPSDGPGYTQRKVVLLVDRGTYSAGSFLALSSKALPRLILMGDTTGGGLGLPNGGYLPNGWFYRFSVTQAFTNLQASRLRAGEVQAINDENYENGVPPDIQVSLDRTDLSRDEIIERAIKEINK